MSWIAEFFDDVYLDFMQYYRGEEATRQEALFIQKALGISPGKRVLDVACGHGRHMVDSTHVTRANGPLHVYLQILHIISDLGDLCKRLGCIALYLGGDNVAVLLPEPKAAYEIAERVPVPVRVGVGVAKRPYTAFVKATKALDYLRSHGVVGVKVLK